MTLPSVRAHQNANASIDCKTNDLVDKAYLDKKSWAKKSISAAAGMGKFSSDRSIVDYAKNIWKAEPVIVPDGTISV